MIWGATNTRQGERGTWDGAAHPQVFVYFTGGEGID